MRNWLVYSIPIIAILFNVVRNVGQWIEFELTQVKVSFDTQIWLYWRLINVVYLPKISIRISLEPSKPRK